MLSIKLLTAETLLKTNMAVQSKWKTTDKKFSDIEKAMLEMAKVC